MRVPCPAAGTSAKVFGIVGCPAAIIADFRAAPVSAAAQVESTRAPGHTSAMTARILLCILACLAAGCEFAAKPVAPLSEGGKLVVLTINGPATWYEDAQGQPSGFEHDLVALFAKELGVPLEYAFVASPEKAEKALAEGRAHLAAALLPRHFDLPGGLALGPLLPHGAAPARVARDGPEAALARGPRRPARRRDRRHLRRPAALLAAEALRAHRAAGVRHLARGPPRAAGRRAPGRGAHRFGAVHRGAQAFPAARRRVRRGQARRLRLARGRRRPEAAPRPHEGLLREDRRRRDAQAPLGPLLRACRAHLRHRRGDAPRAHQHDPAQAQGALPRGRAGLGLRLAPHRRHRLPGVALGPARHLAHRRARAHDAHRGHRRPPQGRRTGSTRAKASSAARAISRCWPTPCPRASASPTAPGWRSPRTTSASATSRTRASSRSGRACRRTRGRT